MSFQFFYSSNGIREVERLAVGEGIDEWSMMRRAAEAAFVLIKEHYATLGSVTVFCGPGNNGGDGLVLAAMLQTSGVKTQVLLLPNAKNLGRLPAKAYQETIKAGVDCLPLHAYEKACGALFVDALLGIGLAKAVHGEIAKAITWLNAQQTPVLALDVPSGLSADTGNALGAAIKAQRTITFIGPKLGCYTADGPDYCGKIHCASLKLESVLANIQPNAKHIPFSMIQKTLKPRLKNSHKGAFGHILLVGGGLGMPGSILLAAKAAMRVGAGMVSIATHKAHIGAVAGFIPEAMVHAVEDGKGLIPLLAKASVLVLGPGLGEDAWARSLYDAAIGWEGLKVVDASALRLLAQKKGVDINRIITPHPGEAGALLACNATEVGQNRLKALQQLVDTYGGVSVLKGCGSLVGASDSLPYLCTKGNPGMASAGMGDVLSGVIAGLLAQKISPFKAAALGVLLHALAADSAAKEYGMRGLLASDVINYLTRVANG